jgi:hypothetical protein
LHPGASSRSPKRAGRAPLVKERNAEWNDVASAGRPDVAHGERDVPPSGSLDPGRLSELATVLQRIEPALDIEDVGE